MIFNIMTLFPELFNEFLNTSIIKINLYNIRDYSLDKNKKVDDYVYGGGNGMLLSVEPIHRCYEDIVKNKNLKTIYMSPKVNFLIIKK